MTQTRRVWAALKSKAPRLARLIKFCALLYLKLYRKIASELSTPREAILARAVEIQCSRGMASASPGDGVRRRLESVLAPLGIRYLDRRYRRVFRKLFRGQWNQWFDCKIFSGNSITLVIDSLAPGGSERQAVTTLLGLVAREYRDLSLLCTHFTEAAEKFYAPLLRGSPVSIAEVIEDFGPIDEIREEANDPAALGLRILYQSLPGEIRDITWYARELLARRPKIVHTWLDYTNAKAAIAAAVVGVPRIVLSTRSLAPTHFDFFQPYMREAYRALAARPSVCLLNNSEAGARDYEQWLGLPYGRFKVIRNGFDFSALDREKEIVPARELRARLGISQNVPVVGSVLRFSEEKRPFFWVDIAAHITARRPDVKFLMIGDGPLWKDARGYAEACGMSGRILMPGNEKLAAAAIAAMDVFLLTSRAEGLPNVLVEAQALGVPVVTTDVGGAVETLVQGKTGLAVSPHSADLLADAVLKILEDPAWREAARQAAPKFVRERFPLSRMMDLTLAAYLAESEFAEIPAPRSNPRNVGSEVLRIRD